MASLRPPGRDNEPLLDRTTSLSRLPSAWQAQKTTLGVNFTMVSPTAIKYHAMASHGVPVSATTRRRAFPPPGTYGVMLHSSNASEFIEVHTTGKITRYGHFSFPYSLTNPRKAMTYTLARRDRNDYLILLGKNFHPQRTSEFNIHVKIRFNYGSDSFSAGWKRN